MKIKNWIKPYNIHYWKNIRTRDEVGIKKVDNLYIAYVKVHSQLFKKYIISKRPQTLIKVEADAINYMKNNS